MTSREMAKLFRPFRSQFTEQLNGIDLDDIPIFKRKGSLCQQDVKGLARVDENLGLFADIRHGKLSYEWGDKKCGRIILSLPGL